MANFFIDRPIFAWVLAILLCLTGTLAIFSLPVEQYPDLAPPNVRVTANYPGASAQTLENTVTQVIEQNMTGLDNLMYMSSQSSGTGQASVTLSFKAGTDPDEAVQQVQNQLQSASNQRQTDPRLPSANPGAGCANAGAFVANYSRSGAECDEARQRQRNRRQLRHRAGRQSHGLYP